MKIYTDTPEGVTVVKNTFIDQYMPQANGEFVKVYLYLLRCANTGRELSLSSIADVLEHTEMISVVHCSTGKSRILYISK